MAKKIKEEYISRDDLDIEVYDASMDDEPCVYVKITNFDDDEEARKYAEFLAETLPLLLFETKRVQ